MTQTTGKLRLREVRPSIRHAQSAMKYAPEARSLRKMAKQVVSIAKLKDSLRSILLQSSVSTPCPVSRRDSSRNIIPNMQADYKDSFNTLSCSLCLRRRQSRVVSIRSLTPLQPAKGQEAFARTQLFVGEKG